MGMKTPGKSNKLRGQRVYLAGPIDHAEDDGVGWRKELTMLKTMVSVGVKNSLLG
jgi:hypothetical protein